MSEPLSDDAELAELEYRLQQEVERDAAGLEPPFVSAKLALRLVAEVRRLRAVEPNALPDGGRARVRHEGLLTCVAGTCKCGESHGR